jgi:hypothetical protein
MRLTFGALIAIVLLGLYVYAVLTATAIADCMGTKGCNLLSAGNFTDGMAQAMSLIGALVSTLVIAELSITEPGKPPVERALALNATERAKWIVRLAGYAYFGIKPKP